MKLDWSSCFKAGVSAFLLFLCITYWSTLTGAVQAVTGAATPLILGFVIAYMVNILMSFYEKRYSAAAGSPRAQRLRRPLCMVLAYLTVVAIVFFVVRMVLPQLLSCLELMVAEIPPALAELIRWLDSMDAIPQDVVNTLQGVDWNTRFNQLLQVFTSGLMDMAGLLMATLSSLISILVTALLSLIFSIYLLLSKEELKRQCSTVAHRYLNQKICIRAEYVLNVLDRSFHNYVVGQCIEAVVIGVLCTLGMMVLRLPYAAMVGALIAFTALIPVAGAYIGAGCGAFMILTVSPVQSLVFLVFIVVLQQLETNLIYPRVVGSSLGLPGIWVLAAVTVGGGMAGVLGMLLSVPLAATAYQLLRDDVRKVPKEVK